MFQGIAIKTILIFFNFIRILYLNAESSCIEQIPFQLRRMMHI